MVDCVSLCNEIFFVGNWSCIEKIVTRNVAIYINKKIIYECYKCTYCFVLYDEKSIQRILYIMCYTLYIKVCINIVLAWG